ncbi:glycosyltransferase 87 family protein [Nocardia arizonensis]|uniref:glycosyltransferase 87 family protein n=1 Tax=Nocardia arizonensis TaxID=1141647 RepID=UPI0006D06D46|nr:glycosyltransferase 87 family protein [Nocardia arizonensis]
MSWVRGLWSVWVLTRVLMVVFTGVTALPHSVWDASAADLTLYREWAEIIVTRHTFPLHDERWQYPPGAGALLALPWVLGGGNGYNWLFFALIAAADAAALGLLIRAARRDGGVAARTGPWVWVLGVALLGRICYGRFDLVVACAAAAALLWLSRRPRAAGAAVAAGVLLKLWPVLVLLGARGRTLRSAGAAAVCAGVAAAAGLSALGPGGWSLLRFQSERGLQIESPAATPLLVARLAGGDWSIVHRYGADEIVGPAVSAVAACCVVATLAGGALLLVARWRLRPAVVDLALCAVLLATVTSRVLSPQYLVWAVAVAAVCALDPRTTQRPVVTLVLAAALTTQIEFPFVYDRVATGALPGVVVLVLRNGLLIYATVWSLLRLRHGASRAVQESRDGDARAPRAADASASVRVPAPSAAT